MKSVKMQIKLKLMDNLNILNLSIKSKAINIMISVEDIFYQIPF